MHLTLITKYHLAGNAWSFDFRPSSPLRWQAGQFIKIDLPHSHPDAEGSTRRFTIASAPHEAKVTITTRLTETSFKTALAHLPIGGQINVIDSPAGDFTWVDSPHPLIFVAQGIGITAFCAIIKHRLFHQKPVCARLMYANFPGQAIPYAAELAQWSIQDSSLEITPISEIITPAKLAELIPKLQKRIVYVSGPKSLVALCAPPYNLPTSHLKQDTFPNYATADY